MGKLFSLLVLLGLGYAGIYFYYGVVIEKEVEQQLEARGLSSVSVGGMAVGMCWNAITIRSHMGRQKRAPPQV